MDNIATSPWLEMLKKKYEFADYLDFDPEVDGYAKNAVVQSCVNTLNIAYSEPRFIVRDEATGFELPEHDLQKILDNPNELMSGATFRSIAIQSIMFNGSCFIQKREKRGKLYELYPYTPRQLMPQFDPRVYIRRYVGTDKAKRIEIVPEDIIPLTWIATVPDYPTMGMSPIRTVRVAIQTLNEVNQYIASMISSEATPRIVVTYPKGTKITDSFKEELDRSWKSKLNKWLGKDRQSVTVLTDDARLQMISFDFQQLQMNELIRSLETQITGSFRIHPAQAYTMIGMQSNTYNNSAQASRDLIEKTVVPLWTRHAEDITRGIKHYYPDVYVDVAYNEVLALMPSQLERVQMYSQAFRDGVVTEEEYRNSLWLDGRKSLKTELKLEQHKPVVEAKDSLGSSEVEDTPSQVVDEIPTEEEIEEPEQEEQLLSRYSKEKKRRWRSVGDGKDRKHHKEMNGVETGADGKYRYRTRSGAIVRITGPRDPSLPLEDRKNCRCYEEEVEDGE